MKCPKSENPKNTGSWRKKARDRGGVKGQSNTSIPSKRAVMKEADSFQNRVFEERRFFHFRRRAEGRARERKKGGPDHHTGAREEPTGYRPHRLGRLYWEGGREEKESRKKESLRKTVSERRMHPRSRLEEESFFPHS